MLHASSSMCVQVICLCAISLVFVSKSGVARVLTMEGGVEGAWCRDDATGCPDCTACRSRFSVIYVEKELMVLHRCDPQPLMLCHPPIPGVDRSCKPRGAAIGAHTLEKFSTKCVVMHNASSLAVLVVALSTWARVPSCLWHCPWHATRVA